MAIDFAKLTVHGEEPIMVQWVEQTAQATSIVHCLLSNGYNSPSPSDLHYKHIVQNLWNHFNVDFA